jgi:hypothetical protein
LPAIALVPTDIAEPEPGPPAARDATAPKRMPACRDSKLGATMCVDKSGTCTREARERSQDGSEVLRSSAIGWARKAMAASGSTR